MDGRGDGHEESRKGSDLERHFVNRYMVQLIEDDSKDTDSSKASWPALPANCAVKTGLPEGWSDELAFRVPQISAMNAEKHKRARTIKNNSKTYRFRISNVGLTTCLNIRFQGHTMKLVEVEGSHTLQNTYSSLDVCLSQSYSVLCHC
ncbi:hypothetical protein J5N97_013839 [Dioscorea zingiberensis]|uniref:Plastocyanin-like domain-containing protein n=1 Tax=Dioscorea zingiberensis TaxID=325984 RepID=A0A9D5CRA1_9LILI|nr:hypothetical protein J5N97_013839 [Dioscorea zingiberensis]